MKKGCVLSLYKPSFPSIIETTTPEGKECLNVNVGKRIAELRAANDMSQQTLADLLFVSRDLVSKWENGTRTPDYPTVQRIAEVLGISSDLIIDKKDLIFKELKECVEGIDCIQQEQLTEIVNNFVRKLSNKNAVVFLGRYYYLKTTAEISAECKTGENHVRSMLSKIRKSSKNI